MFSFIQHPDFVFDPATGDDVAVLHLTEAIPFGDNMQPIELASPGDDFAGQAGCYITGWGVTCKYAGQSGCYITGWGVTCKYAGQSGYYITGWGVTCKGVTCKYIKHGHCLLIHGKSVFAHIG